MHSRCSSGPHLISDNVTSYVVHITSYRCARAARPVHVLHLTSYIVCLTSYILHLTYPSGALVPLVQPTSYILRLTYILHHTLHFKSRIPQPWSASNVTPCDTLTLFSDKRRVHGTHMRVVCMGGRQCAQGGANETCASGGAAHEPTHEAMRGDVTGL